MSDDQLALVLGELAALMAVETERLEEVEPESAIERACEVFDSLMTYIGIKLEDAGYDPMAVIGMAAKRMRAVEQIPGPTGGLH